MIVELEKLSWRDCRHSNGSIRIRSVVKKRNRFLRAICRRNETKRWQRSGKNGTLTLNLTAL